MSKHNIREPLFNKHLREIYKDLLKDEDVMKAVDAVEHSLYEKRPMHIFENIPVKNNLHISKMGNRISFVKGSKYHKISHVLCGYDNLQTEVKIVAKGSVFYKYKKSNAWVQWLVGPPEDEIDHYKILKEGHFEFIVHFSVPTFKGTLIGCSKNKTDCEYHFQIAESESSDSESEEVQSDSEKEEVQNDIDQKESKKEEEEEKNE